MGEASQMPTPRPYYHEFAWAYDLLQTDPVTPRVDFIQAILAGQEIPPNATVLDAGCGTGRYAVEFQVCGVDRSPGLIGIARGRLPEVAEKAPRRSGPAPR